MDKRRTILYLAVLIIFLAFSLSTGLPVNHGVKTSTERYFNEIMSELNEALKEKAKEERKHISLLLNMTEEMKELSAQVRGMKSKLENITG